MHGSIKRCIAGMFISFARARKRVEKSNARLPYEEENNEEERRERDGQVQIVIFISSQSEGGLVYFFSGVRKSHAYSTIVQELCNMRDAHVQTVSQWTAEKTHFDHGRGKLKSLRV